MNKPLSRSLVSIFRTQNVITDKISDCGVVWHECSTVHCTVTDLKFDVGFLLVFLKGGFAQEDKKEKREKKLMWDSSGRVL